MTIEQEQEEAESRLPDNAKRGAHERSRQRILDKYLGTTFATPKKFRSPG